MKNEEQQVQEKNKEGISTGNNRKDHHTAFDEKSSICKDPNSFREKGAGRCSATIRNAM